MQGIQFQENYIQRLPAGLSVEQIIRQLAQPLVAAELVVPDFADHVLKREATYNGAAYRTTVRRHSAHGP